jgi:glycerol uptake facilitator-like aquaporin
MSPIGPRHASGVNAPRIANETAQSETGGTTVKPIYVIYEFTLTAILLFIVVSAVRWLMDPASPVAVINVQAALGIVALIVAAAVLVLIRSRWGRLSGAHLNPAISVALWLMGAFPRRAVGPYIAAQLAGSLAGAGLARLALGHAVSTVGFAAVRPAGNWGAAAVFTAEAACLLVITLLIGYFLANPRTISRLPFALAAATAVIIALLGPRSGGSTNPARQFGPALLSGQYTDIAVYLAAPILGAACGAGIHHLLVLRARARRPRTFRLCPLAEPTQNPAQAAADTPQAQLQTSSEA